jgi:cytochrome c oxidase subunit 1
MPRRIPDYPVQFTDLNQLVSVGAFVFGASQLLFVAGIIICVRGGQKAESRAWEGALGLEWTIPSPAPYHSFTEPPAADKVWAHPYQAD